MSLHDDIQLLILATDDLTGFAGNRFAVTGFGRRRTVRVSLTRETLAGAIRLILGMTLHQIDFKLFDSNSLFRQPFS